MVIGHHPLESYLQLTQKIERWEADIPVFSIKYETSASRANEMYFGHSEWAVNYFNACHRDSLFKDRWRAAIADWTDKVVIEIGCGSGNVFANLGGHPRLLIGVDISMGALKLARQVGYVPLRADAHDLPICSESADIVLLNATLHHCDDMAQVLREAGRLVKPGGLLITDHDPQKSAWDFKGLGKLLWHLRLPIYRYMGRGGHASAQEQTLALATEVHHRAGDGVTADLFHHTLVPQGFEVKIFPHNHDLGAAVLQGQYGRAQTKYRLAQRLSGINPNSPAAALTLMCVARKGQHQPATA